ncbi:hypothetical protein C4546_01865 [Candidatus Parcubacteria bacterium]|nr:MAG: hypothetical protein C4546_01865 [Candidatus Parcubacteria bacterium]
MNKIEKLLIFDATNSRTTAHVFIARPSPAEERTLGKLGFVAEIASADRINQELLSRLQDFLKAAYYTSPEVNSAVAFEHTIQACNRYLSELISDFGSAWVDNFSMVIFTIRDQEIHFADAGRLLGFLIHDKKVTDLLGNRSGLQKINPLKIFLSISSGELKSDNAVIFSTANLMDYFSIERLRRTIMETPLGGAGKNLEDILRKDPNHAAFAAIILRAQAAEALLPTSLETIAPNDNINGAPQRSIDNMLAQNAQTQEFLTPSMWPFIQKSARKLFTRIKVLFRAWILRKPTRISAALEAENLKIEPSGRLRTGQVITPPRSRLVTKTIGKTLFNKIPNFIWQSSRQAWRATPKLLNSIKNLGGNLKRAPQQIPATFERQVNTVKSLPQKSRWLFLGVIGVAAVLAIVLIIAGVQRQRSAAQQVITEKISNIEKNLETARSVLLYGDEDRVKTLLTDAKKEIETLPNKSKSDKAKRESLLTDVESVLAKTRHEIKPEIKTLISLPAEIKPLGLALLGNNLYTLNSQNNLLVSVSLQTSEKKDLATLPGNPDILEITTFGSGNLTAITSNLEIIEQRPSTQKGTRYGLVLPNPNANLVGLVNYNTALYFIDVANNLILKATRAGPGYTATNWLKQNANLDSAADIAVDGALYVLTKQGEIQKYNQGQRAQLALSTVEPPLTSAVKFAADTNLQNFYVLDTAGKRIVVFTKAGKFVNQYVGDALANVSALVVNERTKKIYLLNSSDIQSIDIQK